MSARAVLLDFYGTLARAVAYGARFEEVFATNGLTFDDRFRQAWATQTFDGQEHFEHSASRDAYRAWERQRLEAALRELGVADPLVEGVAAELHAAAKDFTLEAYDEVPELLERLRQAGLVVAVCSNWDWDLDRALVQAGLDQLVDVAVTSAQVGVRKPHPHIYDQTLGLCGVKASEALFAGDTWGPDVKGPREAGMTAVHVLREDALETWAAWDATPAPEEPGAVPTLEGLLPLLGL